MKHSYKHITEIMLLFMFLSRQRTSTHLVTRVTLALILFSHAIIIYYINFLQISAIPKNNSRGHMHDTILHHP